MPYVRVVSQSDAPPRRYFRICAVVGILRLNLSLVPASTPRTRVGHVQHGRHIALVAGRRVESPFHEKRGMRLFASTAQSAMRAHGSRCCPHCGSGLSKSRRNGVMGQYGDRLEADRARLADLQALGELVGRVGVMRRLPPGASPVRLSLRGLKFCGERVFFGQPRGQTGRRNRSPLSWAGCSGPRPSSAGCAARRWTRWSARHRSRSWNCPAGSTSWTGTTETPWSSSTSRMPAPSVPSMPCPAGRPSRHRSRCPARSSSCRRACAT